MAIRRKIGAGEMVVRLPGWTNCVLYVEDIGDKTLWGRLVDIKTNQIIGCPAVFPLDQPWKFAFNLDELLDVLN